MRLIFVQLSTFREKWLKLGLKDEDLRSLEGLLVSFPTTGDLIPGTGGLRKVRFAPPRWHRGSRGALRVIYALIESGDVIYLFTLYGKNEQSDLSADEKSIFRRVLGRLRDRYN